MLYLFLFLWDIVYKFLRSLFLSILSLVMSKVEVKSFI